MNEIPPTMFKPKPPIFTIIYRILVLMLLAILAGTQLFIPAKEKTVTDECESAILVARMNASGNLGKIEGLLDDYDDAVYSKADNINQQIFRANEYQVMFLKLLIEEKIAIDKVYLYCR